MSNIKLLTVTNAPEHSEVLRRSALHHNWDYHCIEVEWLGFGTKLIGVYNYLKEHPEVERFVFADALDVVAQRSPEEFEYKKGDREIILSCEKGLWPPILIPFRSCYPQFEHGFNYINSGLYYMTSAKFIELFELFTPFYETDDQYWMNMVWLIHLKGYKYPDFEQELFNSHSFIANFEYTYNNGRIQIMGNDPVFIHSNGKTKDEKLDELVREMLG